MYALLIVVITTLGVETEHVTTTRSLVDCEVAGIYLVDSEPDALDYVCVAISSHNM